MSPCELRGVGEQLAQAEAAESADERADEPATAQTGGGEVADGEEQDQRREAGIEERREPLRAGDRSFRAGRQRQRLQPGQCDDEHQEASEVPERRDQAEEKYKPIDCERVGEASLQEEPRGFVPARIERDPARAAGKYIGAGGAVDGQVLELQLEPPAELGRHVHADRKMSVGGAQRIFELRVEEALVPEELRLCWQGRAVEMCAGGGIARERAVGQNGDPRLARNGDQRNAVHAPLDLARGSRGDLFQLVVDAREIEETRAALRQPETRKQVERDPDEQPEAAFLRLGKTLQDNFWWKVGTVRGRALRKGEDSEKRDLSGRRRCSRGTHAGCGVCRGPGR